MAAMKLVLLSLLLAAPVDGPTYKGEPRQPHPFAPTLPQLTDKENKAVQDIVNRFIDQDTGKLQGQEAAKALADFKALGPEAFFALLEGLNKAANMEDSCPAVLIGKKLMTIIGATKDLALLEFAKQNIGADVSAKRHQGLLSDMRTGVTLRKAAVTRMQLAVNKQPAVAKTKDKTPKTMTAAELAVAASKEKGDDLKKVLTELATRKGDEGVLTLGTSIEKEDPALKSLSGTLLAQALAQQSPDDLKSWLKKGRPSVRAAAARTIGEQGYKWVHELIDALVDSEEEVRQAARGALVKLAGNNVDHGPQIGADTTERSRAQEGWREHWKRTP
jgi:hypothetical protein